ncbi:MAG: flavoprotein oxidoreductase [Streptosporangiales bacterium]|nr:flavoprotein oxidoreductase [Streptosporangiales bacterium]
MAATRTRLVVVGGDAGGMTAASQAHRLAGDELEVVAFERGAFTSYSACGIPYWVAGDVGEPDDLVARSPDEHRRRGIDVRLRTEVTGIDVDRREVTAYDQAEGREYTEPFDKLVVATGAAPARPPVPGVDSDGVFGVQTLDDGYALLAALDDRAPRRAVVIGGGYIGVEMAEAMLRHGLDVTLVDRAPQPMTTLDPDMGAQLRDAMTGLGIDVVTDTAVEGIETAGGWVSAVVAGGTTYPADLVVLGTGVRPATALARDAGLRLGDSGAIRTDLRMTVAGQDDIWAAGDCVESFDRVSQSWTHVPLGTHANKQGRVAGTNIGGGYATFPGIVRTAVSKVCDLEIGRTGLREKDATAAGFEYVVAKVDSTTRAGYFPGARPITVKVLAEIGSGRLLGVQIVGREGAAKRIDTCALALWNEMTVGELSMVDLSYAPPFSPVWDPVLIAARKAADIVASS